MSEDTDLEVQRSLGNIEGMLKQHIDWCKSQVEGHETRISGLERWRYYLAGAIAVVGFLWKMV